MLPVDSMTGFSTTIRGFQGRRRALHFIKVDWFFRDPIQPDNLRRVDLAVHEWLGLAAYRIRGFSDEWLPGPRNEHPPAGRIIS
jgi:hypothetical protein